MSTPRPSLPDALLRQALARRAAGPSTSAELLDDVLAAVETLPQRRGWTLPLVSELRLVPTFLLVAVLLSALIGLALFAGGRIPSPDSSGLVAYESGGDIYVGDLATGETRAIVTGPAFEAHPIFSPDGTHIAFYRSPTRLPKDDAAPTTASILVVRADGSDEQVIVPAGFPGRALGGFSWTPDGTYLVVNHDVGRGPTGGLVSLFDAFGVAEPRLLTPPLHRWVGAPHPQTSGEVAPMFRPPTGDRVLSFPDFGLPECDTSTLVEMDVDGSNLTDLLDPARMDLPFQAIGGAIWSPDAGWIALTAGDRSSCIRLLDWTLRTYVMSADGGEPRRLTRIPDADPEVQVEERVLSWSPDGSMVLIERWTAEARALIEDPLLIESQTIAVDVHTGTEHKIASPTTWPYGRWESISYFPTSSWSPDGQSVLVFKGPGTRPIVIDVETGASTELPWASDSHPSWRLTD